jgi:hypothetical protein
MQRDHLGLAQSPAPLVRSASTCQPEIETCLPTTLSHIFAKRITEFSLLFEGDDLWLATRCNSRKACRRPISRSFMAPRICAAQSFSSCAVADCVNPASAGVPQPSPFRRSVPRAAWQPVDQAVRVSTCEAQSHDLSGSLCPDIRDEISPSRRVRKQGNLIVRQSVELCIRVRCLALVTRVKPGRCGTRRGFVFHVVPSASAAGFQRMLAPITALVEHTMRLWFPQGCDDVVHH